jgi:hypothetical protein
MEIQEQTMTSTQDSTIARLRQLAHTLIDPAKAVVAVPPESPHKGYWFGGGNAVLGPDGKLYLCGRYRSAGDSRTGLDLGDRGRELAVFAADPAELFLPTGSVGSTAGTAAGTTAGSGLHWTKVLSLDKTEVAPKGYKVLSIEGAALRFGLDGVELFISSEKERPYPEPVTDFRKPGTGIWTIERLAAPDLSGLKAAKPETVISSSSPATLQIKDPWLADGPDGTLFLFFCHHSFNWSSSGTGCVTLTPDGRTAGNPLFDCWPRGPAWDVAITRGTSVMPLPVTMPAAGLAAGTTGGASGRLSLATGTIAPGAMITGLAFYDGGECLRNLDEHAKAVKRPRGYSCEELGGLGCILDGDPRQFVRLSDTFAEFISPDGTGCLRYVDVLTTPTAYLATWQQSRPDGSQALMINILGVDEAARILGD